MTRMKHPQPNQARAIELYRTGDYSVRAIAAELSVSIPTVSRWLERAGLREIASTKRSPERNARIARDYAAGMTFAEICRRHRVTGGEVVSVARKAGLPERQTGPRFTDIAKQVRERVVRRWNEGIPAQVIGDEVGLHVGRVKRVLKEEGVKYEPRRHGDGTGRWHKGEWRREDHGYVRVKLVPTDPYFCMVDRTGYVLEHRYEMAKKLGRPLADDETVHHIDNDPKNNKPSNLQLRKGRHGKHSAFQCAECGSRNIVSIKLDEHPSS